MGFGRERDGAERNGRYFLKARASSHVSNEKDSAFYMYLF